MKVLSVSCSHCGAPAQIEADRNVGFCTYCGAQLFLDDEKQRIELSGQVNVDGMLTLDKQIRRGKSGTFLGNGLLSSDEPAYRNHQDDKNLAVACTS